MEQVRLLWELQESEQKLSKINKEIKKINMEDQVGNVEVQLKKLEYDLITDKTQLEMKKIEVARSEKKLKQIDEKIKELNQKLYSGVITDNKQLMQMQEEENLLKEKCGELEEKTFAYMEKIEKCTDAIEVKQAEYDKFREDVIMLQEKHIKQTNGLSVQSEQVEEQLKEVYKNIKPDFIKKYEAIKKRKSRAVVKVIKDSCTGCHMNISMSTISKLKKDKEVCYCDNCGRILLYDGEVD